MRAEPRADVLAWMDDRPARELYVTAVTEAEVRTGIALLPEGRRRRGLAEACERAFGSLFAGRVLPFDGDAVRAYAEIASARRVLGRRFPRRTSRLRRLPARVAWRWQRATYETLRALGSKYSTHGTVHERNAADHNSHCFPPPASRFECRLLCRLP